MAGSQCGAKSHIPIRLIKTWRELLRGMWSEDYLRFADQPEAIRPKHLNMLVFIGDLQD
jgi:hypothetical protein